MANQIALNNQWLEDTEAAALVAKHLRTFWTPEMIRDLKAHVAATPHECSPVVISALNLLNPEEG